MRGQFLPKYAFAGRLSFLIMHPSGRRVCREIRVIKIENTRQLPPVMLETLILLD
jgi:hypothetical protein